MLYETIIRREPIEKGWSGDRKYRAEDARGNTWLLRISPPERYERRAAEFLRNQAVAALDIPMCRSLEFGRCSEGVYTLQTWIDGEDAEEILPNLPAKQQYRYGLNAGEILKKIHEIPAPEAVEDWAVRFNRKIDRKIAAYTACELNYEGGDAFLDYLQTNRHLLADRPQTYQHGDYHTGNMMIRRDGTLTVIDFEKDDWGDPWEEFNRIVWSAQLSPAFAAGMVDGYFGGEVPTLFWELLALYICSNAIGSLPWAIPFGQREVDVMHRQAADILRWYDSFCTVIPSWYAARCPN